VGVFELALLEVDHRQVQAQGWFDGVVVDELVEDLLGAVELAEAEQRQAQQVHALLVLRIEQQGPLEVLARFVDAPGLQVL
jgi:hypothetical protein